MNMYNKKRMIPLVLPALILFLGVVVIPFAIGVVYSFTSWRGSYFAGGDHFWQSFVGIENYIKAFHTKKFIDSLVYTVKFTVVAVLVITFFSLFVSLLASKLKRGAASFYRTVFFLPNLLGGLALGYIWQFIFEIVYSKILFGPQGLISLPVLCNMTQNNTKALFALVLLFTWQMVGYMMIIFTIGLNNIPADMVEAARIDGASNGQVFLHITLPMLMPSFTIVLFLTLSKCFMLLDQNIALTDGNFGTRLLATQILRTTRDSAPPDYGLAQAQAVIFFILIAVVALFQVSITTKREVEI
jgi:raffinose/stachyose/melibiose transport system permease protein